jgi:hypothetical protein
MRGEVDAPFFFETVQKFEAARPDDGLGVSKISAGISVRVFSAVMRLH